jgi:hypothetical protein
MALAREPARPHDPGYPTIVEFDPRRRAALRAIGLAGLSAVGLQLVGCPGGGSPPPTTTSPPPPTTTSAPPPDTGRGPATDTAPPTDTDWVPWKNKEREEEHPLAGGISFQEMDRPVAFVVGGGPIAVEFQDGVRTSLAVALVAHPSSTPRSVQAGAPEHVEAVRAAAKTLPSSTCDSSFGLQTLSRRIQEEVLKATPGLVIEGVQTAPLLFRPAPALDRSSQGAGPDDSMGAAEPSARGLAAAPAPALATVTGSRVWVPCGKPGCTSCGKK